ncbi:MAG: MFS transporter, partial [Bacteroidia bacterium]|nr:MFS transporter [Bacteroidia bacterium]
SGLGKFTNQASSYLIMMIMGGGLVSWFQGWLSEPELLGIRASYLVGIVCFIYLAYYGWKATRILKQQGVKLEELSENH